MQKAKFLAIFLMLALASCSKKPAVDFSLPPPNPEAPMAFFGEGNMNQEMRQEYAATLQNAGLYNFILENYSDKQMENAVEIRLNYEEQKKNILILNAEFLKSGETTFKFTIKEEYEKKKQGKKVLLDRFLQEIKRTSTSVEPRGKCRG